MRHAVILAGGSGTRLWPASRRARPKQLLALHGGETLLAAAARRVRGAAGRLLVVTAVEHADDCATEAPGATIVAEPLGRNTAAALGLAAVYAAHGDPDAVLGGFPADHHIADERAFAVLVERAYRAAEQADVIATIGVTPTHAETGFGYLELGAARDDLGDGVREVARFVEKPDPEAAAQYVAGGRHAWNAGMFFVRASRLLADLARLMPATSDGLREIATALRSGGDAAARAVAAVYPRLPSVSIDRGVMEHVEGVVAVPGAFGWSDVGSWQAVATLLARDARGNASSGDAVVIDGEGNLAFTDRGAIALVGVTGLAVVRAGDAVLVIPIERAQDVRAAVAELTARGLERYL